MFPSADHDNQLQSLCNGADGRSPRHTVAESVKRPLPAYKRAYQTHFLSYLLLDMCPICTIAQQQCTEDTTESD